MAALVKGVQLSLRISRTSHIQTLLDKKGEEISSFDHTRQEDDIPALENIVKERLETLYHPACTARMAKLEDGGVVDARLRVHGLENVRIADASVFPTITSGHTVSVISLSTYKSRSII